MMMMNSLRFPADIDPNIGAVIQREHPKIRVEGVGPGVQKTCSISETMRDRTKVTTTD